MFFYVMLTLLRKFSLYLLKVADDLWGRKIRYPLIHLLIINYFMRSGGPRRIRTPDPLIRSQVLYPAELSVRGGVN
jgi:hypothetical protein